MKIRTGILALLFMTYMPVYAQDNSTKMDHSNHVGEKIHESMVQGYHLAYHLLDLKKGSTRHLMVYIMDPEDKKVEDTKVGFLVEGPDGSKQKLMAEGMKGAFGVNVRFGTKGAHLIKVKVVTGGKKLLDSFHYKVE